MNRAFVVSSVVWGALGLLADSASGQTGCPGGSCDDASLAPVVSSASAGDAISALQATPSGSNDLWYSSAWDGSQGQNGSTSEAVLPGSAAGKGGMNWGGDCSCNNGSCGGSVDGASCGGACGGSCTECRRSRAMARLLHPSGCGCNQCRGCLMGLELFGEYLYLRPRDAEVPYAVPIDGPIAPVQGNGIPIGDTRVTDMDYRSGFRVGLNAVTTQCGRVTGQWTHYESRDTDQFAVTTPDVIRSLVTHPLGDNVASDGLQTSAQYDIDFDLIDLGMQTAIRRCPCWAADFFWGVRYGQLNQEFGSDIDVNGGTSVNTDIAFNGTGPRVGLMGQRNLGWGSLYSFGRGEASFLLGNFNAKYVEQDQFAGVLANTGIDTGRIVPELEMELGLGCGTPGGRFQLRCGYLVSAWLNAVTTSDFINGVRQNNPNGLNDGITFDGLVIRTEARF